MLSVTLKCCYRASEAVLGMWQLGTKVGGFPLRSGTKLLVTLDLMFAAAALLCESVVT